MPKGISRRTMLKGVAGATAIAATTGPTILIKGAWAANLKKVSMFIGTTPHFGNIIVAKDKGFFAKEGLDVSLTNFTSGTAATEAFRAGEGDLVDAGDMPSLKLWDLGNVGICPQTTYGHLSVVVGRKAVEGPEDVRGKKIGVLMGSTAEYFAKLWLDSAGMSFEDVDVVNLQPAGMVIGLVRKDIDAFVVWQPFGWRAMEATDDAHIVTTAAPFFNEWQISSTSPAYQQSHRAELIAYCGALHKASQWCNENRAESAEVVANNLRLDAKLVRRMTDEIEWTVAYSQRFRDDMNKMAEYLDLTLDWDTMFDPSFLGEVDSSLVS